jgi:hypothetical protein
MMNSLLPMLTKCPSQAGQENRRFLLAEVM